MAYRESLVVGIAATTQNLFMAKKKRAYLRDDNSAAFDCPDCGVPGVIELRDGIRSSTPVRTRYRCQCGRSHVVFVEKRAHVRRTVRLGGQLQLGDRWWSVTILNLSRTGMMFEVLEGCELQVGTRAVVEFQLEHAERTPFLKKIMVRHVSGRLVGAEYRANRQRDLYDPVYDLALAQLRP